MGDYLSPKRKDVVERLKRRIDLYRRHQNGTLDRYEQYADSMYDQTRQDSVLLHQRWLDSRAKKAAKSRNKELNSQNNNQRKRKSNENNNCDIADINPIDSSEAKQPRTDDSTANHSLSVQIVQQITSQQDSQIQTNVTVKSTIKSFGNQDSSLHANVECKQEAKDECPTSQGQDFNNFNFDVDELTAILETLEKEEGEIPPELMQEIDKYTKDSDDGVFLSSLGNNSTVTTSSSQGPKLSTGKSSPGKGQYVEQRGYESGTSNMTMPNAMGMSQASMAPAASMNVPSMGPAMPGIQAPQLPTYQAAMRGPTPVLESTGPAAETLKQMAAQHQQQAAQNQSQQNYNLQQKQYMDMYQRYNNYYSANADPNVYPYNHMMSMNYGQQKMSYDTTKPMAHYDPRQSNMPSSLQQLQNQVHSHFNPRQMTPNMQISQTQQVQMSQGRVQMTQSQRMAMNGQTMAQQQYSAVRPGYMPPSYMQSQDYRTQYNMHRPSNPLQPMQNMVNQTPRSATPETFVPKTEPGHQSGGQMNTAPLNSVPMGSGTPTSGSPVPSSNPSPKMSNSNSMYTSAIMRGQRPPNVNVGPDGLNISQQRTQWNKRSYHGYQYQQVQMADSMMQQGHNLGRAMGAHQGNMGHVGQMNVGAQMAPGAPMGQSTCSRTPMGPGMTIGAGTPMNSGVPMGPGAPPRMPYSQAQQQQYQTMEYMESSQNQMGQSSMNQFYESDLNLIDEFLSS